MACRWPARQANPAHHGTRTCRRSDLAFHKDITAMTAPLADITIHAAYASVVEDDEDAMLFIGFAQGEEEDEPYALFRQPLGGGPSLSEKSMACTCLVRPPIEMQSTPSSAMPRRVVMSTPPETSSGMRPS